MTMTLCLAVGSMGRVSSGQASCECTASERRAGLLLPSSSVFLDQSSVAKHLCPDVPNAGMAHTHATGQGLRDGPTACGYCLLHHTHTKRTAETKHPSLEKFLEGRCYPHELKCQFIGWLMKTKECEAITSG